MNQKTYHLPPESEENQGDYKTHKERERSQLLGTLLGPEGPVIAFSYHNNGTNDYHFLTLVRAVALSPGDKLLPQEAFLLGFNTNAEETGPTTKCCQMCGRNKSMVRSPRKEKVGFRKERNSRKEDYLDIGLRFTAFVAQPTDGCALGQVSTKEVKPLAFCFFKECQRCR